MRPQIFNGKVYFPRYTQVDKCPTGSIIKIKFNGPILRVDRKGQDGYTICKKQNGTERLSPGYPVILYT